MNERTVDLALALEHGLNEAEYNLACSSLGRVPNYTELGVFSVMWSEHCSYKSSRVHLSRLPTKGPRVIQGPGENAGVVDIGDGWTAVFKMESHNHPSFIEPHQGAATGVGGILRDVFTMGARPVALLDSLRFGAPDHPKTRGLLTGVSAGIAAYGNAIGVPTVGGDLQFDSSYNGNILVNAFALGVCRKDKLFFGRAAGLGNPILYVGARTGRDGIHGATMASAEFDDSSEAQRPTVQVGDPFMEKLLLEACLEIFAADILEGVQDMGAAGLTSSTVEMAGRAGTGVEIDLDKIPRRAKNLHPYEILLSESQERMVMVAKRGLEHRVLEICQKWDLDAVVIGHVTDTQRWVIKATPGYDPLAGGPAPDASEKVTFVDIPVALLCDSAPKYERACAIESRKLERYDVELSAFEFDATNDLLALLSSPNIGSRSWIYRQYDHIVRVGTSVRPGAADAAVIRIFCDESMNGTTPSPKEKWLAIKSDCNGRFCELDPKTGSAMAVAEACRNLACVGAEPIGLTDCLNFGSPQRPEIMAQFRDSIDGMRDACVALGVPIVSGNVSLYNETETPDGPQAILPTPMIGAVGLIEKPNDVVTMGFKRVGDVVALLGLLGDDALGGSEWMLLKSGKIQGKPPSIDLSAEARLQRLLLSLCRRSLLSSAHDCAEGGLAVALAESAIAGGLGAHVQLPNGCATPGSLFGEDPTRVVVSFLPAQEELIARAASEAGVMLIRLGSVGGTRLEFLNGPQLEVSALAAAHAKALQGIVGG
jgi:phosphoribosylformylglycinamidine synthase